MPPMKTTRRTWLFAATALVTSLFTRKKQATLHYSEVFDAKHDVTIILPQMREGVVLTFTNKGEHNLTVKGPVMVAVNKEFELDAQRDPKAYMCDGVTFEPMHNEAQFTSHENKYYTVRFLDKADLSYPA